jgi:hypothetical protein
MVPEIYMKIAYATRNAAYILGIVTFIGIYLWRSLF